MPVPSIRVQCAIAGGGPAGMMLGLLLARAGVKVVVLEKHADFIRDFRGDTIHPSTLDCMAEIGLLDDLLKLPHYEAPRLYGQVGDFRLTMADFSHLATRCKFIALMPQWDFLNFLSARARAFAAFDLRMETAAIGLLHDGARVTGLRARSAAGDYDIAADLVVAADGRHSTMRTAAGLTAHDIGAPMDVLWFKLSRKTSDPPEIFGRFEPGEVFIQINRGDHWQCGYVIAKGGYAALQARGIEAFRARIVALSPGMTDRTDEIVDWKDTSVLSVAVDRPRRMAPRRPALHRRQCACHVAGWRRWHQSRDPGRSCRRQSPCRAIARGACNARRPRRRAGAPHVSPSALRRRFRSRSRTASSPRR